MTTCSGKLGHSSLDGNLLFFLWLVVVVGVDGEDSDHVVAVVNVDESFDFDDTDLGSSPTAANLDEFASEPDVPTLRTNE